MKLNLCAIRNLTAWTVQGPTGPNFSEIFKFLLVLVQSGPKFSNCSWSWFGLVQRLNFLLVSVRSGPRFQILCWSWSGLVQDFNFLSVQFDRAGQRFFKIFRTLSNRFWSVDSCGPGLYRSIIIFRYSSIQINFPAFC